jgi:hypothetical protein
MANNRANKVDFEVVPGATTDSVNKLVSDLKASVGKSNAEAFVAQLVNVTEAFSKTLAMGHNLSKTFITYSNAPANEKGEKVDLLIVAYKDWQERLKSQKSLGLMNIPPLSEEVLKSLPDTHKQKVIDTHQIVLKMKEACGGLIKSHQEVYKKIGEKWKDLDARKQAAGAAVQPSSSQHSVPLSSSHGARNQGSAQAAANANRAQPNVSQVEEKQQKR